MSVCSAVSNSVTFGLEPARVLLSMRNFRREYWSRLPFPPPGGFPDPGIKPMLPAMQEDLFYW